MGSRGGVPVLWAPWLLSWGVIAVMQEEMGCKEFPAAQGMLLPRIRASWPQSYCQRWPQRAQNMPQNPQVFSSREMLGCAMNPCVRAHSWLGGDPGLTLLLKAPVFLVVFCFFLIKQPGPRCRPSLWKGVCMDPGPHC